MTTEEKELYGDLLFASRALLNCRESEIQLHLLMLQEAVDNLECYLHRED